MTYVVEYIPTNQYSICSDVEWLYEQQDAVEEEIIYLASSSYPLPFKFGENEKLDEYIYNLRDRRNLINKRLEELNPKGKH